MLDSLPCGRIRIGRIHADENNLGAALGNDLGEEAQIDLLLFPKGLGAILEEYLVSGYELVDNHLIGAYLNAF